MQHYFISQREFLSRLRKQTFWIASCLEMLCPSVAVDNTIIHLTGFQSDMPYFDKICSAWQMTEKKKSGCARRIKLKIESNWRTFTSAQHAWMSKYDMRGCLHMNTFYITLVSRNPYCLCTQKGLLLPLCDECESSYTVLLLIRSLPSLKCQSTFFHLPFKMWFFSNILYSNGCK